MLCPVVTAPMRRHQGLVCEQWREEGGELGQGFLTPTATKEGSEGVRFPLEPLQIEPMQSPWDGSDIQHPDFASNVC